MKVNLLFVVLAIPVINALAAIFTPYYPSGGLHPGIIRGVLVIGVIGFCLSKRYEWSPSNTIIAAYVIYCLILVFTQSSDVASALYSYIRMVLWAMMFPIGYLFIRSIQSLEKLNKVYLLVLSLYLMEMVLANLLGFGRASYVEDSIAFGEQGVNVTKTMALILLMWPLFLRMTVSKKLNALMIVLFTISAIFVLVGLKRSALAALIGGGALYLLLTPERLRAGLAIGVIAVIMLAVSPLYIDQLLERYEARRDAFETVTEMDYQEEGRFNADVLPAVEMWWEGSVTYKLFGSEIFRPTIVTGGRNMHVDYARVLVGSGLLGFVLFMLIYGVIAFEMHRYIVFLRRDLFVREMYAVFWALMIGIMIMGYAGTVMGVELRSILFLYWGAMMGVLRGLALERSSDIGSYEEKRKDKDVLEAVGESETVD